MSFNKNKVSLDRSDLTFRYLIHHMHEMSKAASPTRFSGDLDHFYDPNFTADISQKMRVPKSIKIGDDETSTGTNYNTMLANEKFDMHVPDRILVAGDGGRGQIPGMLLLDEAVAEFLSSLQSSSSSSSESSKLMHNLSTTSSTKPESTPPIGAGEGLTPSEELVHLRRQMAKLNRRVMAIELDNLHRQQREKIIYAIGLAYFFFKTVFWLARSS
ncbi:hypothetical protein C0J52_19009 [Blattella germanica]|nr:hypothetical protein C0J52_19009 [Blattella germanica]